MSLCHDAWYEFNEYCVIVRSIHPSGEIAEQTHHYVDIPMVLTMVRKMVNVIATDYRDSLFSHLCSGCRLQCTDTSEAASCLEHLGKRITHLEYVIFKNNELTAVASSGQFIRDTIRDGLLKSLLGHVDHLISGIKSAGSALFSLPMRQSEGNQADGTKVNGRDATSLSSLLTCHRCGRCCRELEVVLSRYDVEQIDRYLALKGTEKEKNYHTEEKYTWNEHNRMLMRPGGNTKHPAVRCIFLEEHEALSACRIYEARPRVCRRFLPGKERCGRG